MGIRRRELLGVAGGLVLGGVGTWMAQHFFWAGAGPTPHREAPPFSPAEAGDNLTPDEALDRLVSSNRRFQQRSHKSAQIPVVLPHSLPRRPFAVIVSCADCRLPAETVFEGCGEDLFVLRQFAHLVDTASLHAIDYAVNYFKVPLILVLGHTGCSALGALLGATRPDVPMPPYLQPLSESLNSVIKEVHGRGGDVVENAVDANIRHTVRQLRAVASLRSRIAEGRVRIRGARLELPPGNLQLLDIE